jgi:membrane-associated progesterone receptor component
MVSDEFVQFWVASVVGVLSLMAFMVYRRKHEHRVELPAERIFIPRPFTAEALREYDGIRNTLIFVGVKGVVYNVAKEWYGPESAYNAFAGHESSRQLGKTKVGRDEVNADWTTLSSEHLETLNQWEERFVSKYIPVGWFVPTEQYFAKGLEFAP